MAILMLELGMRVDGFMFANVGFESPATLDFIRWFDLKYASPSGKPVVYLEAEPKVRSGSYRVVDHGSLKVRGEPMVEMIDKKKYLPNRVTRICTIDLKIKPIMNRIYDTRKIREMDFIQAIGIRADEPFRVAKIKAKNEKLEALFAKGRKKKYHGVKCMPLVDLRKTVDDVHDFWAKKSDIPESVKTAIKSGAGISNCRGCFFSGIKEMLDTKRDFPEMYEAWLKTESLVSKRSKTRSKTVEAERKVFWAKQMNATTPDEELTRLSSRRFLTWHGLKYLEQRRLVDLFGKTIFDWETDPTIGCDSGYCHTDA